MKYWVIADLHIAHRSILKYCPNRKYNSVYEMEEDIIRRYNKQVSNNDLVYILGDVAFEHDIRTKEIFERLNGRKIIILGNHCKRPNKFLTYKGVELVVDELHLTFNGYQFILSHYPYRDNYIEYIFYKFLYLFTNKWYHKIRFWDKRPYNSGKWLLHGHVHNLWKIKDNMINVGFDQFKRPISFDEIISIINKENK